MLNGNQAVNPEVRERVTACAREHGYQPNVMAQSLAGSRTHLIGVILTDISNAFFIDMNVIASSQSLLNNCFLFFFPQTFRKLTDLADAYAA